MKNLKAQFKFAKRLTRLMDTQFSFLGVRFGLDPILDFIPFFGDLIGTIVSFYLFLLAYSLKVPKVVYLQMMGNIIIDSLLGLIPLAGIVFDAYYRSNIRNLAILEEYLEPEVLIGEILE
ncbi:MAG: DUF4112 domain-containing protein [Candidatus Roizmanbacteria bacterium]|nr:DUF4112 domain-containing protein [Candidatus Roizmanbacteria bacterium]